MAPQGVLSKRPRPNYDQASLEQQRPGATTPGWLSKSKGRSSPSAGGSSSPESNVSSKENKMPAGRSRRAAKKPVTDADAATPAAQAGARKTTQPAAPRPKSAEGRKKQGKAAGTHKVVKASRKSAPARVHNIGQKKQAAKPAADSPAASDGSRDRRKSARDRKAASPVQKATEQPASSEKGAGRRPAARSQPAVKGSSGGKGKATRKRAPPEPAQPTDKAAKRPRTEPSAAQEPAERPADASSPAAAAEAEPAHAAAAPPQPQRRTSGRARASAAGAAATPAAAPAALATEDPVQRAAPAAAEQSEHAVRSAEGGSGGASPHDTVASTPGSDLARRVDANISALQTDYAKLQEAYQALKRQSAAPQRPGAPAAPPAAAPAPPSDSFLKLQAAHEELMGRYTELKAKKMEGLQEVLVAQAAQVEEHRAAANKVAEHWKAEAARHEAAAIAAQAPQMQAELEALKAGRQRLMEQVLDLKASMAERDSRIAQLQHLLARATLAAQTAEAARTAAEATAAELQQAAAAQQAQQEAAAVVEQVVLQLEGATGHEAAAAPETATGLGGGVAAAALAAGGEQQPENAAEAAGVAVAALATDAAEGSGEGSGQRTASPAASVQQPQPTPFHLKEARAMVPEGLSLSDTYGQPSASSSQPSGRVLMHSAGRPLVPYLNGASREQGGSGSGANDVADGSQVSVRTPAPGEAEASPSPMPCVPLPGGGATPSNASLPVRQLQFASAARCATRPAAGTAGNAQEAENVHAAVPSGGLGGPLHTLLGIESSPFKNGGFLFEHRPSGYTFRLAPQADDAPVAAPDAGELWYKPYTLGELYDELPQFLREELTISTDQRPKLLNYILDALARHSGADSL